MTTTTPSTKPLVIAAAVAVILFSGVGIAKMMNWLPANGADAANTEAQTTAETDKASAKEESDRAKVAERKTITPVKAEICSSCGVVTDISPITQTVKPSGLGAVAGMALALLERADSQQWAAICRLQHAIDSVEK